MYDKDAWTFQTIFWKIERRGWAYQDGQAQQPRIPCVRHRWDLLSTSSPPRPGQTRSTGILICPPVMSWIRLLLFKLACMMGNPWIGNLEPTSRQDCQPFPFTHGYLFLPTIRAAVGVLGRSKAYCEDKQGENHVWKRATLLKVKITVTSDFKRTVQQ